MKYPRSIAAIRTTFFVRLCHDRFDVGPAEDRVVFDSVRSLIAFIAAGGTWRSLPAPCHPFGFPGLGNLSMPFGDFLDLQLAGNEAAPRNTVADVVKAEFCQRHLATLLHHAYHALWSEDAAAALAELQVDRPQQWLDKLLDAPHGETLTARLFTDLKEALRPRPLLSFFERPATEAADLEHLGGSLCLDIEHEHAREMLGEEILSVVIQPRQHHAGSAIPYEWLAKLSYPAAAPHAIARGTAYIFDRFGRRTPTSASLFTATPAEMARLDDFELQHRDCDDLIREGDLAFVRSWQRRPDAGRGAGERCVSAAVQVLRRRFSRLRTVVFDISPFQYPVHGLDSDFGVPDAVLHARQTASAALRRHVDRLLLDGIVTRTVLS